MVKININIEGENLEEIIQDLFVVGIELLKTNKKEIDELIRILSDETMEILMERKIIEKGAQLYKKINTEINWAYKKDKNK